MICRFKNGDKTCYSHMTYDEESARYTCDLDNTHPKH